MIIVNENGAGFVAALMATEIDRVKSETVAFIGSEDNAEERIEDILAFQLTPVRTMRTSVEPVWLIDVNTGDLKWARNKKLRSEWRLITSLELPAEPEAIFRVIRKADDILPILKEWYIEKCKVNPVIIKWVEAIMEQPTLIDDMMQKRGLLAFLYEARAVPPNRYNLWKAPVVDIYISSAGAKLYHTADCKSAIRIKEPITFGSIKEAESAGKAACKSCKPT